MTRPEPLAARARLEAAMTDEVVITRVTTEDSYDPTTGEVTPATPDDVYAGPAMITRRQTQGGGAERGGEIEASSLYNVSVPFDAGPIFVGDRVTVIESAADPDLPEQQLTVRTVQYGTLAARRRLTCELLVVAPR